MVHKTRSLLIGALGAIALSAAFTARAQDSNTVIGPPQLKDFQLEGRRQVVQPTAPEPVAPAPAPVQTGPRAEAPETQPAQRVAATPRGQAPARAAPVAAAPSAESLEAIDRATAETPGPATPAAPAPQPAQPSPAPAAPATSWWYYALPAGGLALVGIVLVGRRRRRRAEVGVELEPVAAPPTEKPKPRPDPIPRPWLELALKAERASFTDTEAELLFELEISNKGGSPAKNLRVDVKLFNGGVDQQDKEIGTFFKMAGRESTKLNLPIVEAGITGVIQGRVTMAREEMRALRLDERLLFIPVVAVNALYDWGEGRTGQTSKSYLIGRELEEQGEKMGAFHVDRGPRVWRTIAQRPHKMTKRV